MKKLASYLIVCLPTTYQFLASSNPCVRTLGPTSCVGTHLNQLAERCRNGLCDTFLVSGSLSQRSGPHAPVLGQNFDCFFIFLLLDGLTVEVCESGL